MIQQRREDIVDAIDSIEHTADLYELIAADASSDLLRAASMQAAEYLRCAADKYRSEPIRKYSSNIRDTSITASHRMNVSQAALEIPAYVLIHQIIRSLRPSTGPAESWPPERFKEQMARWRSKNKTFNNPAPVADAVLLSLSYSEFDWLARRLVDFMGTHDRQTAIRAAQWLFDAILLRSEMHSLAQSARVLAPSDICTRNDPTDRCCAAHRTAGELLTAAEKYCSFVDPNSPLCDYAILPSPVRNQPDDIDYIPPVLSVLHLSTYSIYPFCVDHALSQPYCDDPPHQWFTAQRTADLAAHVRFNRTDEIIKWCIHNASRTPDNKAQQYASQAIKDAHSLYTPR